MGRKGPLITLLAGGALATGLMVANLSVTDPPPDPVLAGGALAPSSAPAEPTESEPPSPAPSEDPPDAEDDAEAAPREPVSYVGFVDGGGVSVAILVSEQETTAYVCDGAELEFWLFGEAEAEGEELTLTNDDRGAVLRATVDGRTAEGELAVDDRTFTFTLEGVPGEPGLERFAATIVGGAQVVDGAIVLPDGRRFGGRG